MSHKISLLLVFFFLFYPVFSQEEYGYDNSDSEGMQPQENSVNGDSVFIINSFTFNIEGFTRPYALIYHGNFIAGEEIAGLTSLEKYIQDKTQILINQRVLDSASIEYVIGQEREDGKFPVDLVINTKDTWNIVAIPRPRYSSNSGFDITLKARDYNFLGTMSPLRLDLGYMYNEEGYHFFLFMLDSDIPFQFFALDWNFNFDHFFDYRPNMEQQIYYKNVTGLSVELPFYFTTVTVGFNESFILNEENSDNDKIHYDDFQDGFYMSSTPFVYWEIPTGVEVGDWGELVYSAGISATFNHAFSKWPLDEIRNGPFLFFNHAFGFKRVDWIGNFLRGFDVGISNSFSHDFYKSDYDRPQWFSDMKISGIGHFIITDFFGLSARLIYRQRFFGWTYTEAADVLRGIIDKDINAEYMLSLNMDFPVRVMKFTPTIWFDNPKLRIINFDLHLSPIVDFALYNDPANNTDFSFKNILVSGGLEAIIFPEFFRSLFLRISFAWNFSDFADGKNYEIFIGTDLHY